MKTKLFCSLGCTQRDALCAQHTSQIIIMQLGKQVLRFKSGFTKYLLFLKQPRKKALIRKAGLGQRCCSSAWILVVKVDSDGAACQDVVCHVTRFLFLHLFLLHRSRPAHPSPAALGAARALIQCPTHEDTAMQEHLLEGGETAGQVNAQIWESDWQRCQLSETVSETIPIVQPFLSLHQQGPYPPSPSTDKLAAPSVFLCAQERARFPECLAEISEHGVCLLAKG